MIPQRPHASRGGYSLMEMLLVLVVIGMLATLLLPSLKGPLARYRLQQSADEIRARLGHVRLLAMETGASHALVYVPNTDRYSMWIPLMSDRNLVGDRYTRQDFRLGAGSNDERKLEFLPSPRETAANDRAPTVGAGMPAEFTRLSDGAIPIVFQGDGTAVENQELLIADTTSNRRVTVIVNALTGTIRVSTQP